MISSILLISLLGGCDPHCVGDQCVDVPDTPWDPGASTDTGASGYGYGDGDGSGDIEETPEIEIVDVRSCDPVIRHKPSGSYGTVQAAGEFNGWEPQDMSGPDSEGYYSLTVTDPGPGEYAYKFVYDGEWEGAPPINVYAKWSGGSENRNLRVGDCDLPLLQTVSATSGGDGVYVEVKLASAASEAPLDADAVVVTVGGEPHTPSFDAEDGTILIDVTGLPAGTKQTVRVWASDTDGEEAENSPLFVPLWVEDEPFDWADGLIYFVFTDRFRNGDWGDEPWGPTDGLPECSDYQGGDFLGVIHAIEEGYFADLGVNTLWLSPVYENPEGGYLGTDGVHWYSGYHGYWPIEPDDIEQRFGDHGADADARLRELIDAAHAAGIRVMFDLVLNHVHEDHVYIDEHPEWFGGGCVCGSDGCGWEEKPVECWFTDYLPDLNYQNHEIVQQVMADTLAMVEDYDVDALRVDAAKHMDHVIMRTLSMRVRDDYELAGGAEFYVVGETFTSDHATIMDYVNDYELDAQFDFPVYYAIRNAFAYGGSFNDLESAVETNKGWYGDYLMSPFLGNHDVSRFASEVTGAVGDCWSDWYEDPMAEGGETITEWDVINRMSMAFAFTLTQPGVPLLYYGDEIGLHGGGDPDNRRMMSFDPYLSANQSELLSRVQAIGQARAAHAPLRRGARTQLWVDDGLLVYALDYEGEVAIVAMNKGDGARSESVSVSGLAGDGVGFSDALGGGRTAGVGGGAVTIELDPWEYVLLVQN